MDKLIAYIEQGKIDNAELLQLFTPLCKNASLLRQMQATQKTCDTHIRYQVWKQLPQDLKAQYTQTLEKKSELVEEMEGRDVEVIPAKETPDSEATAKTEEEVNQDESDQEEETAVMEAALLRKQAILSNSLKDFAENDDEGRKAAYAKIAEIDKKLIALRNGDVEETTKLRKDMNFDFVKSDEEIAAMSASDKIVYNKMLAEKLSRASKKLKDKLPAEVADYYRKVQSEIAMLRTKL